MTTQITTDIANKIITLFTVHLETGSSVTEAAWETMQTVKAAGKTAGWTAEEIDRAAAVTTILIAKVTAQAAESFAETQV